MKSILLCTLGSIGFCAILNVRKRNLPFVFAGAFLSAFIFETMSKNESFDLFISALFSSLAIGLFSEITARIIKAPSSVIYLPSSIPLLPGSSLFYAVYSLVLKNENMFKKYLLETLNITFGIAMGCVLTIIFVFTLRILIKKKKET